MKHYLTAERLEELKQELNDLKMTKRAEVAERLKRAKELGDLSENSEYFEAREEQSQVEARIFELEEMVKNAEIITKASSKDIVQMGSTIEVAKDGQKFKFNIVGSNEAKPEDGLLSNESPLGKAFMGKKNGEQVKVKTPSGEVNYKIVGIE
ncbi:MAG: transcription elongation factor GreA [bacterium]|nr:transcription elongation factor GreA [bacterium]